jgi:Sec-independent protein translocase protein TatA
VADPAAPAGAPIVGYDARMFGIDLVIVLVVILGIVLVWRGPKILPKWGETLGRGVKATRKEVSDLQDDAARRDDDGTPPAG